MDYEINTNNKWVYCNHPEKCTTEHMAAANKCVNQVTVPAGSGQIFYSYNATEIKKDFYFGIQVYNPGERHVLFKKLYHGFANNGEVREGKLGPMAKLSWERYFKGYTGTLGLLSGASGWTCNLAVPAGKLFTGNLRYRTDNPVTLTAYLFHDKSEITGTATPIDFVPSDKNRVYSGLGDGYFLMAFRKILDVSELAVGDAFYFYTNSRDLKKHAYTVNGSSDINQIIPLTLTGNNKGPASVELEDNDYRNLANWSVQYFIPFTFKNSSAETVKISCAVKNNYTKEGDKVFKQFPIIVDQGKVLSKEISAVDQVFTWKTITVLPGESVDMDYQSILGTNSVAELEHLFTVIERQPAAASK